MTALKKLETGVPGLDILTLGGIPEGRSTLITGKSGTGKTVTAMQIAVNLAPKLSSSTRRQPSSAPARRRRRCEAISSSWFTRFAGSASRR